MAIAFVQVNDATVTSESSKANSALNTTSGNMIIVTVNLYDATNNEAIVTGIADTAGNTYVKAIGVYRVGINGHRSEVWYAENITGNASNVTTVTFTGTVSFGQITVSEYSGVATSSSLDDTSSATPSSTTSHSSGNATSSVSGCLVIGGSCNVSNVAPTVGSGFTRLDSGGNFYFAEYSIVGAAGDYDVNYTTSGATDSVVTCAIFKPVSAAGTNVQINIGDSWKTVAGVQINIGDSWKTVAGVQINIGDTWKTIF